MNIKQTFDQFYANLNGQRVEVSDSTNSFQCMDLAYNFVFSLGLPKATIQRLYAKEVYTKATDITRKYFDLIPNSPTGIPQVGDLVVFDATPANIAGHISVANGVGNLTSFQSFDQNWIPGQKATVITHNYDNPKVLGWLRAKITPTYSEAEMTAMRLERDENWNLYQEQIKKTEQADKTGYERGFKDGAASTQPTNQPPQNVTLYGQKWVLNGLEWHEGKLLGNYAKV